MCTCTAEMAHIRTTCRDPSTLKVDRCKSVSGKLHFMQHQEQLWNSAEHESLSSLLKRNNNSLSKCKTRGRTSAVGRPGSLVRMRTRANTSED